MLGISCIHGLDAAHQPWARPTAIIIQLAYSFNDANDRFHKIECTIVTFESSSEHVNRCRHGPRAYITVNRSWECKTNTHAKRAIECHNQIKKLLLIKNSYWMEGKGEKVRSWSIYEVSSIHRTPIPALPWYWHTRHDRTISMAYFSNKMRSPLQAWHCWANCTHSQICALFTSLVIKHMDDEPVWTHTSCVKHGIHRSLLE